MIIFDSLTIHKLLLIEINSAFLQK